MEQSRRRSRSASLSRWLSILTRLWRFCRDTRPVWPERAAEWSLDNYQLRPEPVPEESALATRLRLLRQAEQYREMLSHPAWHEYEREVTEEAQRAVQAMVTRRPAAGESLTDFALKMIQLQEFIASCYNVVAIPRHTIEAATQIQEEKNGRRV